MRRIGPACVAWVLVLGWVTTSAAGAEEPAVGVNVLEHTMESIKGEPVALADFEGKVLMLVNVASRCGLTPQYAELTALHDKYAEKGLVIIGFPANNFGAQEPGTNLEILSFCTENYGVEFPMMAKVSVKGDDAAPLYQELTCEEKNGPFAGEIAWNFTKFLVGRDGHVIGRFEPRTKPTADEVVAAIEAALGIEASAEQG